MSFLTEQDKIRRDLEERFPGWHVWYVPNHDRTVTWCAQPWPLLNTGSPEHLGEAIREAHEEAAAEWNALAGIGDYGFHAPGVPRAE